MTKSKNYKKSIHNPDKYRSEFARILELYCDLAYPAFRRGGTVSKRNYIVKIKPMPNGVYYYLWDDLENNKVGIELDVNISRAPAFEPVIRRLACRQFENLPKHELSPEKKTKDGTWLMLQFFYPRDTPPLTIVNGLFLMIDQTYGDLRAS